MELIVKKTHELTDNEISRYCEANASIFLHMNNSDLFYVGDVKETKYVG